MTDHTIEAHFELNSNVSNRPKDESASRDQRIILAMAMAIGGENSNHPLVVFEATKIYRAVMAMREAMAKEDN